MRTYKQNVVELDQMDEVIVRIPDQEGGTAEVRVSRVGSDDENCPLETPFLRVEMLPHWAYYSAGDEEGVVVGRPLVGPFQEWPDALRKWKGKTSVVTCK